MESSQRDGSIRPRSYIYVDESQVGRAQAAWYREDIGIWLERRPFQPPVYVNEDATGGGLDLMLAMARRAGVVTFAIPELPHLRGRLGELVTVGDVFVLIPGLLWKCGASEHSEGQPIADAPLLRTVTASRGRRRLSHG